VSIWTFLQPRLPHTSTSYAPPHWSMTSAKDE